jgi:hypothetical protein
VKRISQFCNEEAYWSFPAHTLSLYMKTKICVNIQDAYSLSRHTDLSQLNKYVARPSCHAKAVMLTPPCSELVVKGEAENSRAAWPLLL